MKKKRGLIWIVTLIAMLVLSACAGDKGSEGTSEPGEKAGDDASKSGEEITLKFVHWINEGVGKWQPVIDKYEAEHPGIKIESIPLVDNMTALDYFKQLDLMASAGEKLDIIMFNNPNDLAKRIDAGLVAPIDEFLDAEGIDINEVYNNSYGPVDGNYYGLPMKNVSGLVMMNKGHLDEAGLEIPTEWTWDDYRDYAKALTTDQHYGSYLHTWHETYSALKLVSKSEETLLLKEDGSSNAEDPLLRESLELRYQLEQVDKSSVPYFETFSQKLNYRQQFFSQEASMIPTFSFMITEWGEFAPDFEIVWAPWPQNEKGENFTVMSGDLLSVSKTSDHKQEAYDFMRWMSTEGIVEQGVWTPSWKEADLDTVLDTLVSGTSNPEAIDLPSLKHSLTSLQPNKAFAPAPYITEVNTEFGAEAEMYLLGEQDLDKTMDNVKKRIQAVVDANQ
ncbi:ABC transporter substrate-binding protein [Sporosarcina beigongshangi]|uniref:ABC transporter substrate-binding protein n=1 Tax=Sporosarcina beigongshangi TaxID=2782538 RepID=UPI001939832B|nr:extracellular solute-binding protein [Sporosarcina beigongshangi]